MSTVPEKENHGPAARSRRHRAAGIIVTVLGTVLLARSLYDYLAGNGGADEAFMLGVSGLIVFLGLYKAFGAGLPRR